MAADATAAETTYGHISTWETGDVTDMSELFKPALQLVLQRGHRRVGYTDVTTMNKMFAEASAFNQDIGALNTSGVTTMYKMFYEASAFNQDIGWEGHLGVMRMDYMFTSASAFDQDLRLVASERGPGRAFVRL